MRLLKRQRAIIGRLRGDLVERGPVDCFDAVQAWERETVQELWSHTISHAMQLELPCYHFIMNDSLDRSLHKSLANKLGSVPSANVVTAVNKLARQDRLPDIADRRAWDVYLARRKAVEPLQQIGHDMVRVFCAISRVRGLFTRRARLVGWFKRRFG